MEEIWFYEFEGDRRGPVTEEALRSLADTEEIRPDSLVWKDGMNDWQSYGSVFPGAATNSADDEESSAPPVPQLTPHPSAGVVAKKPFAPREIRLKSRSEMRVFSALGRAWKLMCSDFWPIFGYGALVYLLITVVSQLYVTALFLLYPVCAGGYYYMMRRTRGEKGVLDELFDGFRRNFADLAVINLVTVIPIVVLGIAAMIAFVIGLESQYLETWMVIVLIVVGAVLLVLFNILSYWGIFATMACMDTGRKSGPCLRLGWNIAIRHWFKLLGYSFITCFLGILGVLALIVGSYVVWSWSMVAIAYLYEDVVEEEA